MNHTRFLFPLTMFCLVLWSGWIQSVVAQEGPYEYVEEIQVAAPDKIGQWRVGEHSFNFTSETVLGSEHPAEPGTVARVRFVVQQGQLIALEIEPLENKAAEVTDGPYVIWKDANTAEVITFTNGKANRQLVEDITTPRAIDDLAGFESAITLDSNPPIPPSATWKAPERLLAISDLEGNCDNVLRFLQNNNVLDENGHWDWGNGHLVLNGDLVDRGAHVTEVMWLVRRLEREAELAGGSVHYILGNHEAMVMAGDLRYIHDKYRFVTTRLEIRYDELYGPNSEIGRWWRTKNGVELVGDLLFVHGGYSPVLDQYELDIDTLNQRIRASLHPGQPTDESNPAVNPVYHKHGPFWYRGYFAEHAEEWEGKATSAELDRILARHNAKHIVIGHTMVDEVGPVDGDDRVIGIDTEWKDADACQGLLVEKGKMWRLTMTGQRQEILETAIK
jgi:Calcineurin-like phosphoesterase